MGSIHVRRRGLRTSNCRGRKSVEEYICRSEAKLGDLKNQIFHLFLSLHPRNSKMNSSGFVMSASNETLAWQAAPGTSYQTFSAGKSIGNIAPSMLFTASLSLMIPLGLFFLKTLRSKSVLPGIPELKGWPIVGAMPIYLQHGMPQLLGKLIAIGDDGVSFANIFGNVLVSVHEPAMVREVHGYTDEVASRYAGPIKLSGDGDAHLL